MPRSQKPRKRKTTSTKSSKMQKMSADLKKQIKLHQRLETLETAQQKINDTRIEEAQVVANLMFSVNAIARVLTEKKIKITTAKVDENGFAVANAEGKLETVEVEIPILSMHELNVARAQVINEYHKERAQMLEEERKQMTEYTYNDETHTAVEWSQILGCTFQQFQEYIDMGCEIDDIVETLAEENLEEREKQFIQDKVNEAVERAKSARSNGNGNGETKQDEIDLDSLTEDEMMAYLEDGTVPERLQQSV